MINLDWSPFTVVSDLSPHATVISYRTLKTTAYIPPLVPNNEAEHWIDHKVAVLWDEDRDTRVLDALAHVLYAAPETASKISALGEHKGCLTVWLGGPTDRDFKALQEAASSPRIADYWPVEMRDMWLHGAEVRESMKDWRGAMLHGTYEAAPGRGAPRRSTLLALGTDDSLVAHINAIYPLGWWSQPKPLAPLLR